MYTLHGLELIYGKNYLNLAKIFVMRLFKMAASQRESSSLEQRSVINFLVAEKCNPCEIYKRMCDAYREACFSQENVYKWIKWFITMKVSQKDTPQSGNSLTLQ